MGKHVLKRSTNPDYVRLPNGSICLADVAEERGYTVEPHPADMAPVVAAAAPMDRAARLDAILNLPEAAGRFQAARAMAARDGDLDLNLAARILAGLPVEVAEPPPAPPAPVDPRADRLASIKAGAAAFNRAKGYAR